MMLFPNSEWQKMGRSGFSPALGVTKAMADMQVASQPCGDCDIINDTTVHADCVCSSACALTSRKAVTQVTTGQDSQ